MTIIRKQTPRKKKHVKKALVKSPVSSAAPKRKASSSTKALSVIDRIAPIGFSEDEGIKINIYGRSATGKTTLAGTFPRPALWIICSSGKNPGELISLDTSENRKTIKQVVIEKTSDIKELVDYQQETEEFATVVLDHATGFQDYALREILGIAELPEQLSWGIATRENWGQVALKCKESFRYLLDLKCNVVLLAQEREFNNDSDEDLVMPFVASALSPSTVGWLNPAVNYIVQTRIRPAMKKVRVTVGKKIVEKEVATKGVHYTLRTGPDAVYTTKFRIPKGTPIPDEIVDPTYDKIMAIIRGGR